MKINKYWIKKTKKNYSRKRNYNLTYRGGKTKARKATEKQIERVLIYLVVFAYLSVGIISLASGTRTIKIIGGSNGEVAQAGSLVAPTLAGGLHPLSAGEIDYENISYMTKKGTVEERIAKAFPEDPKTALAIAKCESQLDKTAIGDTHTAYCSVGLFQIRTLPERMRYYGLTIESLKDIETNLDMARKIKDRRGGWYAWSCWTSGKYKKYL